MMEYLVVHRAAEIYKLHFEYQPVIGGEELFLVTNTGIFYPVYGYSATRVMNWLDDRGFEYYWERDND